MIDQPDSSPDTGVHDYTRTADEEGFKLNRETFTRWSDQLVRTAADKAVTLTRTEIKSETDEREARENLRANKRNFNRMLTLMGALFIGLAVTFMLTSATGHAILGSMGLSPILIKTLAPYTFTITIVLDAGLAVYGYIRKY